MNKEEILKKSKEENKYSDEREKAIQINSYSIAATVGVCVCVLFQIVEGFIFGRDTSHIRVIFSVIFFSKYLIDAIKIRKKYHIILAVSFGIVLLLSIISYVIFIIGSVA